MKKQVILIGLILIQILCLPVSAQDVLEETYYRKPLIETLDLRVDGSISPQTLIPSLPFDYITRGIVALHFADNDLDFDEWAGSTALTNGTDMRYDNVSLNGVVKTIHDLAHIGYEFSVDSDDKNPKDRHISARISFWRIVPPYGLKIKEGHIFSLVVQDNLTARGDLFQIAIEGFQDIRLEPEFKRDWLEDLMVFDNPLKLIILPIVLPFLFIFTGEPIYILLGLGIALIEVITIRIIWVKVRD